jgi:hypothetical protein
MPTFFNAFQFCAENFYFSRHNWHVFELRLVQCLMKFL